MVSATLILPPSVAAQENQPKPQIPSYGGTLVQGTINPPTIINPILTQTSVSASLMALIFDSLVRIDSRGKIVPGLAKSWDVSEDKLVYTFHLRKNVRFHDGVDCTAEDVKFTYEMIHDPKNQSPWRTGTELVKKWEVLDKYTLRMVLREPFAPILYKLTREIAPQHLLKAQDLQTTPFNYQPVGTGPFKLKMWDREIDRIEIEANSHYFEGRPYLDNIIVKHYPNISQLWSALMRHEVDLVKFISLEDYEILKRDPAFKAYAMNWNMYYALVYNLQDPILRDQEVRKAIAHGINVEEIIRVLSMGGAKSVGPFHQDSMGFNPDVQALEYNPVKAKMLLMHRGWQDKDGDGILEKGGKKLEIRLLVDRKRNTYKKIATIIRQQLSEVGIKTSVQLFNDESELTDNYLTKHKPQALLRLFTGLAYDPYDATREWYSLSDGLGKLWSYQNERVDQLFELGRVAQAPEERDRIYKQIHKIIYEDQPACFLFFPASFFAVSSRFENTDELFMYSMPDYTIKDWYLAQ